MADASIPSDLNKVDPGEAWKPWTPTGNQWNRKWAAHLFRRAAFGASDAKIREAIKDGFPKTLNTLLTGAPDAAELSELLTETGKHYADADSLRAWWLYAIVEGGHPLREKLTLFWHNHFATSYSKVRSVKLMYQQNVTLRKHALGQFPAFLLDMSRDTAMLVWLDSNRNVKAAPNENYAREVMELFSLGVGNYTEKDIKEAARAFTGWHHDEGMVHFEFNTVLHDGGEKTVFGKTGKWSGEDIVRLCCEHDACAKFLVGKLYAFLVSETPPPKGLLEPLATQFRKSGYDIADLVKTILSSRLFFSEHAYRKRVKWPVECALGAVNAVVPCERVPLHQVVEAVGRMGQSLFSPPNVKGWRTGTDWLNSATLLARNNFSEDAALGHWNSGRPGTGARAQALQLAPPPGSNPDVLTEERADTPGPDKVFDVCELVYSAKPKDVAAVVKRLGELLFGEAVPPAVAKKIETFLLTPAPPKAATPNTPPAGTPGTSSPPRKLEAQPEKEPPKKEKEPPKKEEPPKPLDPKDVKFDSPQFKSRVREAAHAMMCLPEYQLN